MKGKNEKCHLALAGNLAKEIKLAGYKSVREFAETNDLKNFTVGQIVRGKSNPRLNTLIAIADALKIPVNRLFVE